MEGSISILATIGSNAPFIGLLGTVFGIMRAFHDLGEALQEVGQQTVMTGISIALLATALGLFVAIPSVMLYNYFRRKNRQNPGYNEQCGRALFGLQSICFI